MPLLVLAGTKLGLKGPGVGFSCHSGKQGTTGLLIIPIAIHISVNNHQKLKIQHKNKEDEVVCQYSLFQGTG